MAMNAASAVLRSRILAASALVACVTVAGCYSTSGGFLPHTDGGFTYESTQMRPTTISVLNICDRTEAHPDGTPFFIMEIPPGKQLTFNFDEEGGDDPANRPARMMYSLWKIGTQTGSLENILSCPGKACRKIVVDYRPAPEQARPDESYRLQVDSDAPGPVAQPRAPRNDRHNPDT
jgi:hypothetical protein